MIPTVYCIQVLCYLLMVGGYIVLQILFEGSGEVITHINIVVVYYWWLFVKKFTNYFEKDYSCVTLHFILFLTHHILRTNLINQGVVPSHIWFCTVGWLWETNPSHFGVIYPFLFQVFWYFLDLLLIYEITACRYFVCLSFSSGWGG